MDDHSDHGETTKLIIGIFVVGMFLYSCNPPPSGGPVERKCWSPETQEVWDIC